MLLIVVLGVFLNTTMAAGKAVLGYATSVAPSTLLSETNIQRSQNGKSALTLNSKLASAAQAKANDMIAKNYWSHVSPDGTQPWQFMSSAGYVYQSAGENLAYGFDTSAAAVVGWMNSPGHRANILNGGYTEVGFGIANGSNYQSNGEQTVIVAMYGQPQPVVTPESAKNGTAPVSVNARVGTPEQKAPETPASATPTPTTPEQPAAETPQNETKKDTDTTVAATVENDTNGTKGSEALQAREVSRIEMLTKGNAAWAAIALAIIAGASAIIFFVRHARLWKKLLIRGEGFIIHHPALDIAFVFVAVAGFLLTRTTGFIH
jgi:hypothetical protein